MDAAKFGAFIAESRKAKNMTQKELAKELHVTDKAVSKWERGLGFPDINTIEPLAEALQVSIVEIMKCQKVEQGEMKTGEAEGLMTDTFDIVKYQKKAELHRKIGAVTVAAAGIALFIYGIYYRMRALAKIEAIERILENADGPEAVFMTVKINPDSFLGFVLAGVVLMIISVILLFWRKK